MLEKYMCDNMLLIVPSNIKEKIIKTISSFSYIYSYKIIDENDLRKSLFFDYEINAINYLISKYNLKPDIAKNYLDNMVFIKDKVYKSFKLNRLLAIKKELIENNLLILDEFFYEKIKDKKIFVYGFDVIDKKLKTMLNKLDLPYEIIDDSINERKVNKIYHFETLEDEVEALCIQISKLLSYNVDIKNIKLANVNNDYYFTLKRYFNMYNIPLKLNETTSLYDILCVKDFLNKVKETRNIEESMAYFNNTYPLEKDIYKALIKACNKATTICNDNLYLLLSYIIKNSNAPQKNINNCVSIINLDNYIVDENEYIFVVSVNQGQYPKTFKDEDFLSDNEKAELGIDSSEDCNINSKLSFKKMLNKSEKIVLSYKDKSPFSTFVKSFVLDEENIENEEFKFDIYTSFSKKSNEQKLAKKYDKLFQKNDDKYVELLANNYDISYKTYDHSFKQFDKEKICDYISKTQKSLSYTAISDYFACGFKYYLNNLLNLSSKPQSKQIDIGNVFHKTLQMSYNSDFDFDKEYDAQCEQIEDITTKFYLKKLKPVLNEIIKINSENMEKSHLKKVMTEKKVIVKYEKPIPIIFKGFIDKIMYCYDGERTYVAIIDYKTGNPDIDVNKVKFGLSLQLPIYLYLLKHNSYFKNVVVCGIYLQKLLPEQFKADEDIHQTIKNGIKLQGYSNSSISILSMLDMEYDTNSFIKSMGVKKDGSFNNFAKVLSSEEMDEISNLVEEKIQEALDDICNCKFFINPKIINGKNESCQFCSFSECCFKDHNDNVYLNDTQEGGEEDGD